MVVLCAAVQFFVAWIEIKENCMCLKIRYWRVRGKEKRRRFFNLLRFVPRPGIEPGWVAPLVFETSASTDSAIWAIVFLNCDAKVMFFVYAAKKNVLFFKKSFICLSISLKKSNFAGRLLSARESGHRHFRSLSLSQTQSSQLVGQARRGFLWYLIPWGSAEKCRRIWNY